MRPLTRLEIVEQLPGEFLQPIVVLPWWRALLTALDDPQRRMMLLLLIRQSGKTQAMLHLAVSELLTTPSAQVLFVAAAEHQAVAVYERKLRRPLSVLLAWLGMPAAVHFTRRGCVAPDLGAGLEIVAPNEATGTGRTPTLLVIDEARDVADEVFTALVPSVVGAGGKVLIGSSAGPPKGFFYQLIQEAERGAAPEIWLHRGGTANENPHADQKMLGFLRGTVGRLFPSAMRRELENEFAEAGDELIPAAVIERGIDDALGELPSHGGAAWAFYDLSRRRDLTSRTVVVAVAPRRPEAADHLLVASIRVWDPTRAPTGEVPFEEVRDDLASLPRRFPHLARVLVDVGAESSSLLPWAKTQPRLALRVEPFSATPATNMDLWGALLARLYAGTLSLPRHERLLLELRNLRREEFAFGSKWRVVDSSRKFHRDVSLTLAGAVFAAASQPRDPGPQAAVILPAGAQRGSIDDWRARYFSGR